MNTTSRSSAADALQARLGARLAAGLTVRAESVPHDIAERLRVAREAQAFLHTGRQRARAFGQRAGQARTQPPLDEGAVGQPGRGAISVHDSRPFARSALASA